MLADVVADLLTPGLDADATRRTLQRDGELHPGRARDLLGRWLDQPAEGDRPVRVFGEVVALLLEDGYIAAAVAREDLWNDLARTRSFVVLCGYPMRSFVAERSAQSFQSVCQRHAAITNESYARLGSHEDRGPAVVMLERQWPGP